MSDWDLESIAYGDSVRESLNSDYIYDQKDSMNYAVFVDGDSILLKPCNEVEP